MITPFKKADFMPLRPKESPNKNLTKKRLLPYSPSVLAGEKEKTSKDFESLIKKPLGTGAFADVYLVRNKQTKLQYAIKLMNKKLILKHEAVDAIRQEIEIMYKLESDHIVKLEDHFEDDEKVYLVMEYMEGGTLFEHICRARRTNGKITSAKIAQYLKEIVQALVCMHRANIIHRDIKPENLLIDKNGSIKLADFGFACYDVESKYSEKMCGTPVYCAPEMIRGRTQHKTMDIWSLGVTLFELITGAMPFRGTSEH